VVVLLPCGFGVARTRSELTDPATGEGVRRVDAECWLVDGDAYFNRPGPRLLDSAELLAGLLHPEAFPDHSARFAGAFARWPDANHS